MRCRQLLPEFVQDSTKHSCVVPLLLIFLCALVHPYSSMKIATAWKKSRFIPLDGLDFHRINSMSQAFYTFARCMLESLSVDEILLPRYVKSTNFLGLLLRVEMTPFCLKRMDSFIGIQCLLPLALAMR